MIKLNVLMVVFLGLIFSKVSGQTNRFELAVEGGPAIISLRGNDFIDQFNKPAIGFSGGLALQYNFEKIFSLRTNLAFERKGSTVKVKQMDEYGNSDGNIRTNFNYDYLTVPLLVRATFGKRTVFFANAGPYLGFLLKQTEVTRGEHMPTTIKDNTSSFKKTEAGVSAGLGLLIPAKQNLAFSFEARANHGLSDISRVKIINGGTIKTNSVNFLFGFVYKFEVRAAN